MTLKHLVRVGINDFTSKSYPAVYAQNKNIAKNNNVTFKPRQIKNRLHPFVPAVIFFSFLFFFGWGRGKSYAKTISLTKTRPRRSSPFRRVRIHNAVCVHSEEDIITKLTKCSTYLLLLN